MDQRDLLHTFYYILPSVKEWVEKTLEKNRNYAIPVIEFGFPKIYKVFPKQILKNAKAVIVNGNVPFPPLSKFGLAEFAHMEHMPIAGITYKDTFFVHSLYQTDESLYFHELVHVVQWDRLGVDKFLLAYGAGLMQFGYDESPLEKMAYTLQNSFDNDELPSSTVEAIHEKTDAIWYDVETEINRLPDSLGRM